MTSRFKHKVGLADWERRFFDHEAAVVDGGGDSSDDDDDNIDNITPLEELARDFCRC